MLLKKKRNLMISVLVFLVLLLAISATLAYLTDVERVLNILGIGVANPGTTGEKYTIDIEVNEPFLFSVEEPIYDEDNDRYVYSIGDLLPGDYVYKDPEVKNAGKEDVYVRVKFYSDPEIIDGNKIKISELGSKYTIDIINDNSGSDPDFNWVMASGDDYTLYLVDKVGDYKVLKPYDDATPNPGDSIMPIFKVKDHTPAEAGKYEKQDGTNNTKYYYTMKLDPELNYDTDGGAGTRFIYVVAEAVQARNFTPLALSTGDPWSGITHDIVSNTTTTLEKESISVP